MRYLMILNLMLASASTPAAGQTVDAGIDTYGEHFSHCSAMDWPLLPGTDSVHSDWSALFASREQRRDFAAMREYRSLKQSMLASIGTDLSNRASTYQRARAARRSIAHLARRIEAVVADTADALVLVPSLPYECDDLLGGATPDSFPATAVRSLRDQLIASDSVATAYTRNLQVSRGTLRYSEAAVQRDIRDVEASIDAALDPAHRDFDFRIWISAFFSALIAVMIVSFFVVISRKSGGNIGIVLLSDSGLQFITIFVLIIAIILFGILDILEGRELAAILSGIAGYILGRGASGDSDSTLSSSKAAAASESRAGAS